MAWDDGLEGAARTIAAIEVSPLRVITGPGTGKTYALVRRAGRLLEEGVAPRRILVVTFTRTAAADLVKQLGELQIDGAGQVRAGTLHSLCFSILNRAEVFALTGRQPRPLLPFERRFLLEDLREEGLGTLHERERRLRAFEAAWARLQSEQPGWPQDETDRRFHAALLRWLRFHEAILIGELIPETLRYLRNNPACPEKAMFDHVLVDEYQDLNKAEQELIDLLSENGHLAIIGDPNQSIYSFKYAHPDGISLFHATHSGTHDENLIECRRCPQLVVRLANELIRNNHGVVVQPLQARPGAHHGEVHVVQWDDPAQEAEGLARLVRVRICAGIVAPGRILVLCPRRLIGYAIRNALQEQMVSAHSFFHEEALEGDPKNLDQCQAQVAFTLLTLLANAEDRVALRCWLGFGSPSLRRVAYERLRQYCENNATTPRAALELLASGDVGLPYTGELVERYRLLAQSLHSLEALQGQALADALFPPDQDWAESLRMLAGRIGDDFGAAELREALRIGITQPELPTDVDYVRVMSLHKSKGLSADTVIVAGCNEGMIPYIDPDVGPEEREQMLQEQRRLFYVAITRPTATLVLSSVAGIPREQAYSMRVPVRGRDAHYARAITSRFLAEMGPDLPPVLMGHVWLGEVGA